MRKQRGKESEKTERKREWENREEKRVGKQRGKENEKTERKRE